MGSCTKLSGGGSCGSCHCKKGGGKPFHPYYRAGGKSCKKGGDVHGELRSIERGGGIDGGSTRGGKKTKSKRKTKGKKARRTRRKTAKKSFIARLFKL